MSSTSVPRNTIRSLRRRLKMSHVRSPRWVVSNGDALGLPELGAREARLDLRKELAVAELDRAVRARHVGLGDAVDRDGVVDGEEVALLRGARRLERGHDRVRLAHALDLRGDVGVGHGLDAAHELELGREGLDLRADLDLHREGEASAVDDLGGLLEDRRRDDGQLVLLHGLDHALVHQVRGDLVTHGLREELHDDVPRRLALAEALDARALLELAVLVLHALVEAVPRDLHAQLHGDGIDGRDLRLHCRAFLEKAAGTRTKPGAGDPRGRRVRSLVDKAGQACRAPPERAGALDETAGRAARDSARERVERDVDLGARERGEPSGDRDRTTDASDLHHARGCGGDGACDPPRRGLGLDRLALVVPP
jgi:hypothetical protein